MNSKATEPCQQAGFGFNAGIATEIEREADYHKNVALLAAELLKQNTPEQLATIAAQHVIYLDVLQGTNTALKDMTSQMFTPDQLVEIVVTVRNGYATYRASKSGKASHVERPQTKEKQFVLERWKAWRAQPSKYTSKAAFARAMLDKCEHLQSTKVIEDWCRKWEKSEPC